MLGMMRKARKGVGLLEISLGLAIMAIGGATFAVMQNNATQAQRAQVAGGSLDEVYQAARSYVQANRATLLSSVPVGGAPVAVVAGRTSPAAGVPAGSLQAAGFLPAAWVDRNTFGHQHVVLIRQPTAGALELLVTQQGGQALRQDLLVRTASRLGAAGGFVPTQDMPSAPVANATGMGGAWSLSRAVWTAGPWQPQPGRAVAYAAFLPNAAENTSGSFLSRVNTGNPDDTRMQTSIDMAGNSIGGVGTLNVDTFRGRDVSGVDIWSDGAVNGNFIYSRGNAEANGFWARDWVNGNFLYSRGNAEVGGLYSRDWLTANQWINARGMYTTEYGLILRNTWAEGWGCWENGLMGRDAQGNILSCQGGVLRRPSGAAFQNIVSSYASGSVHTIANTSGSAWMVSSNEGRLMTSTGQFATSVVLAPGQSVFYCPSYSCYQGPEDSFPSCYCQNSVSRTITIRN